MRYRLIAGILCFAVFSALVGCRPNIVEMDRTMYATADIPVRYRPMARSPELGRLEKDEQVSVNGLVEDSWYRISRGGMTGYVFIDNLTEDRPAGLSHTAEPAVPEPDVPAVTSTAKAFTETSSPALSDIPPDPVFSAEDRLRLNMMGTWRYADDDISSIRIDEDTIEVISDMEILYICYYDVVEIDTANSFVLMEMYAVYDCETSEYTEINRVLDKLIFNGNLQYVHDYNKDSERHSLWIR